MPSYTGTGKTRTYLQERALRHAAQDNKKITSFFAPAANSRITLPTRTTPTEHDLDIELPNKAVTLSSDSSHTIEDESTPFLEHETPESTPADTAMSVPSNTSNKFHCLLPTHTADGLEPLPTSFLDMITDEDDTSDSDHVLNMIKTLIMSAKKFKSFTSLFYFNSLKQFIELFKKYQKNPRIKAPMCKASRTVAVSIGKGPYMAQKMHDTFIPMDNPNPEHCGMPQAMGFPSDLPPTHLDFELCGQPKGMLHILEECGLISILQVANGRKTVGECQTCKLSQEAQERMLHEMQVAAAEGADELVEIAFDIVQASLHTDCCMQKLIANQQDFKDEKPLIQLIIEKAGHRCWFLPKFHCELNPIEMYWGQAKACECSDKALCSGNTW